jgi:predicted kinase
MGRYSPAATARVYEKILERAGCLLELGESVVLDASWVDAGWRARASEVAEHTSSDLSELRCVVDPTEAAARIVLRLTDHVDVSEATPEIAEKMSRSMDPWESAAVIDTSGRTPGEGILLALEAVDR